MFSYGNSGHHTRFQPSNTPAAVANLPLVTV